MILARLKAGVAVKILLINRVRYGGVGLVGLVLLLCLGQIDDVFDIYYNNNKISNKKMSYRHFDPLTE